MKTTKKNTKRRAQTTRVAQPRARAKRVPFSFPREAMDFQALSIVERLQRAGYVSYFVGGCVRDVLIGKTIPKDFDIATDARP